MLVNIICVFKKGGGFTRQYVRVLHDSVKRNSTIPFKFHCLSEGRYNGWWNKVDMFKIIGPCVYIDLDTVITRNVDGLLQLALDCAEEEMYMLTPFNPQRKYGNWASGIVVWNGDHGYIYKAFNSTSDMKEHKGDQTFIVQMFNGECIKSIQDEVSGIYSYKRHCKLSLPKDLRIACFHGRPRPAETTWKKWIKFNWREGE